MPALARKLGFPGPRPQPPASRAGPSPAASFGGRAGTILTEGRRAGGSREAESPSPAAPSWSRRRPAAVRPGPAARAPPARPPAARRPPRWPRAPARPPRAPRRSRSRTRPQEQRARAPALPAALGARHPGSRCRRALTRCLRRSAALRLGRRPLPAAGAGPRAAPRGLRSHPPTRSDCLSSAAVTTAQPSAPPPRPPPP